ncbi:MAG: ABC transporter substrate-binding protein [Promethearchaeota archaeon]
MILAISPGFTLTSEIVAQESGSEFVFTMTLLVPRTGDRERIQSGYIIANELQKIGIGVDLVLMMWETFDQRVFYDPTPADYTGGGFDAILIGWLGIMNYEVPYTCYASSYIGPGNNNYFPLQNETLDALIELWDNAPTFEEEKDYTRQIFDLIAWDLVPETAIYQPELALFHRDNVRGVSLEGDYLSYAEMFFSDGHSHGHNQTNELVIGTTYPNKALEKKHGSLYWNWLVEAERDSWGIGLINPDFYALNNPGFRVKQSYDISTGTYILEPLGYAKLPYPAAGVPNNHTGIPSPAGESNATVWEIELSQDVYWHEGYGYNMSTHGDILKVDADDVVFTYETLFNPDSNYYGWGINRLNWLRYVFGADPTHAIIKRDPWHVQFHFTFPPTTNGAGYWTGKCPYFPFLFPQHILDPTYDAGYGMGIRADGSVAPNLTDWPDDNFNRGTRTPPYTGPGVIGNGPYIFEGNDSETITFVKNPYWFLNDDPRFNKRPDKIIKRGGFWTNPVAGIQALCIDASVDLLDSEVEAMYDMRPNAIAPGVNYTARLDPFIQTLGFNILNGAGGNLANADVRLAISHMIPRQDIVDLLFQGWAQPNFLHIHRDSPFYPHEIEPIQYNLTRALEYMERAGYNMDPYKPTHRATSGFGELVCFVSLGGMAVVVLVSRAKKRQIQQRIQERNK